MFSVGAPLAATFLEKSVSSNSVTERGTKLKGDKKGARGVGGAMGEQMGGITNRFLSQPCLTGWAAHVSRSNITRISS